MTEDAKYLELYKKHRPQSWRDIIGQNRIVGSLKSAVKANKVPGAYLFTGPRGCGKTSAALVLAAAINCENEKARAKGDACGSCAVCINIQNHNQLGINYISMANQGGVDAVRKIVDQARLAQPVNKSVWILDEAHNLSDAAWDALLIPLESATMPALFIFCSTEAHKIPAPIMSRIQARNFGLVDATTMKSYIEQISESDELDLNEEQIDAAIRLGRGSVRDTLTELESIISTGSYEESINEGLLIAIQNADIIGVLKAVNSYASTGEKMRYLAEDLYSDLRDILLLRTRGGEELVAGSPITDLKAFKEKVPASQHIAILDAVGEAVTSMSVGAAEHRIILEAALLKAVQRLKRAHKAAEGE